MVEEGLWAKDELKVRSTHVFSSGARSKILTNESTSSQPPSSFIHLRCLWATSRQLLITHQLQSPDFDDIADDNPFPLPGEPIHRRATRCLCKFPTTHNLDDPAHAFNLGFPVSGKPVFDSKSALDGN